MDESPRRGNKRVRKLVSITLIIPKIQKSLNILLRQHWASFRKEQAIFDMLTHASYTRGLGRRKKQDVNFKGRKVKITYTLYFKDSRKRDLSNYGQKMLDDSLVKEGIIDDDNCKVIIEEAVRIRQDKYNERTEILIEEAQ